MRRVLPALGLLLLWPVAGAAQQLGVEVPVRSPVLTLTQERLYTESLYGKAVQALSEQASRALQAENRKIEASLEAEERDLTFRRATLPPAEFRALAEAFDTRVEGIRAAQEAKARSLTQSRDADRQRFFETAVPILADLMQDYGAVAILDKGAVVLSFDRVDVTEAAIARIDAVLGDGSSPPGATAPATPDPAVP
ncbi:OmpH family outer membrane protein [Paracoccaceae bacterium Fryx2]|nr:OmpH family outer membrane protein [Paracoccaceae bacterium Fryx2]